MPFISLMRRVRPNLIANSNLVMNFSSVCEVISNDFPWSSSYFCSQSRQLLFGSMMNDMLLLLIRFTTFSKDILSL